MHNSLATLGQNECELSVGEGPWHRCTGRSEAAPLILTFPQAGPEAELRAECSAWFEAAVWGSA